jgi:GNAT superfamily N-acetyltransferase
MRVYVEPSPAGGWHVKAEGAAAPVSRHDTEEEARERAAAYARGLLREASGREAEAEAQAQPPAVAPERVRLREGSEVLVREVRPDDKPLFLAGFEQLGEQSRYQRFLGFRGRLTESELLFFTELDHEDHDAIGALDAQTGEGVGVARALRLPHDPSVAEAAVTVIDSWQGRGLGGVLLERLCRRSAARGVRRFSASLRTTNRAMLHLFERLGTVVQTARAGVTTEIEVELEVADAEALGRALRAAAEGEVSGR